MIRDSQGSAEVVVGIDVVVVGVAVVEDEDAVDVVEPSTVVP